MSGTQHTTLSFEKAYGAGGFKGTPAVFTCRCWTPSKPIGCAHVTSVARLQRALIEHCNVLVRAVQLQRLWTFKRGESNAIHVSVTRPWR